MVIVYLILITSLIASLCHFLLTVSEFGVLLLIPDTLVKLIGYSEGPFDLGIIKMKHRFNRLLKTGMWGSGKVLWVLPRMHPLQDLLLPLKTRALRSRSHPYQIPRVNTGRFTALFINMRILKFRSQLTIALFAAVNHLNGPLRKENFTLTGSKGHGFWLVIGEFRSVLCVSVFQS